MENSIYKYAHEEGYIILIQGFRITNIETFYLCVYNVFGKVFPFGVALEKGF